MKILDKHLSLATVMADLDHSNNDEDEEFVDYDSLIRLIPTQIGEARWCKAWQCLAVYLGFLHASSKDASVAKNKTQLQEYTLEGFNTRTQEINDGNQYLLNDVLNYLEWGFSLADISRAKGITLSKLRDGIRLDNAFRMAKEDVLKEVKRFTGFWTKCLGPDKQIPSGKTPSTLIFEVLKMSFEEDEIARVKKNQETWDKETEAQRGRHHLNYLVPQQYDDVQKQKITHFPKEFLTFMLLGLPANEKCHSSFKLGVDEHPDGSNSSSSNGGSRGGPRGIGRRGQQEEQHSVRSGDVQSHRDDRTFDLESDALDIEEEKMRLEREKQRSQQQSSCVTDLSALAQLLGNHHAMIQQGANLLAERLVRNLQTNQDGSSDSSRAITRRRRNQYDNEEETSNSRQRTTRPESAAPEGGSQNAMCTPQAQTRPRTEIGNVGQDS